MKTSSRRVPTSRTGRLRSHIAAVHEALEHTPVSCALVEGTIQHQTYLRLHQELWHIHAALDDVFVKEPRLQPFLDEEDLRAEMLQHDLTRLANGTSRSPGAASEHVLEQINDGGDRWERSLGMLYVIKGSRFGGKVLARPISEALGVEPKPGQGLDYYLKGRDQLSKQWRQFQTRVNDLVMTPSAEEALFDGAEDLMAGLLTLYRSLPEEAS